VPEAFVITIRQPFDTDTKAVRKTRWVFFCELFEQRLKLSAGCLDAHTVFKNRRKPDDAVRAVRNLKR
jgi:hypothetical protein